MAQELGTPDLDLPRRRIGEPQHPPGDRAADEPKDHQQQQVDDRRAAGPERRAQHQPAVARFARFRDRELQRVNGGVGDRSERLAGKRVGVAFRDEEREAAVDLDDVAEARSLSTEIRPSPPRSSSARSGSCATAARSCGGMPSSGARKVMIGRLKTRSVLAERALPGATGRRDGGSGRRAVAGHGIARAASSPARAAPAAKASGRQSASQPARTTSERSRRRSGRAAEAGRENAIVDGIMREVQASAGRRTRAPPAGDLPADQTGCLASSGCSSPAWYISFRMSQPPTNSPFT